MLTFGMTGRGGFDPLVLLLMALFIEAYLGEMKAVFKYVRHPVRIIGDGIDFFDRKLNLKPGMRAEYYSLSSELVVDPRLVVTHELDSGLTLRESLGLFHQPPSVADSIWGNEDLMSSYSTQATMGAAYPLSRAVSISATGFYSDLRNLAVDDPTASMTSLRHFYDSKIGSLSSSREFLAKQFGTFSGLRNTGAGRNFGLELMTRYVGAAGFAWIVASTSINSISAVRSRSDS